MANQQPLNHYREFRDAEDRLLATFVWYTTNPDIPLEEFSILAEMTDELSKHCYLQPATNWVQRKANVIYLIGHIRNHRQLPPGLMYRGIWDELVEFSRGKQAPNDFPAKTHGDLQGGMRLDVGFRRFYRDKSTPLG